MAIELHRWLAIASGVLVVVVVLQSAWRLRDHSTDRPAGFRLQGLLLVALGVTAAGGLGLLLGGARPRELLHFVYAALAFGALPVAASISRSWRPSREPIVTLIAALVTAAAVLRLFGTG